MTADAPRISVEKNYPAAFSEYRRRKNAYWFAMALFIFSGAIIGAPLYALLQSPIPFLAVCAVAALPWCFAHFRLSRWFCPRCGRFFHTNGYWENMLARRCINCGIHLREQ